MAKYEDAGPIPDRKEVDKDEAYYRTLYVVDMAIISTEGLLEEVLRRCHGDNNMRLLLRDVRTSCFSMRVSNGSSAVIGDVVQFACEIEEADERDEGEEPEDWTVVDFDGHCDRWGCGMLVLENSQTKAKITRFSKYVTIITERQWKL